MDPKILTLVIILTLRIRDSYGIIGYDCGSSSTNLTTLSLLGIEECDIPLQNVKSTKVYVQLLQINEFNSVKVIQCKVEIDRLIRKCGMFSHSMDVLNGKYSYIYETSRQACDRMHAYGTFEIGNNYITGLKSNQTASRPITLAGNVNNDGSCSGSAYSDPYGSWTDVVVIGSVKVTLQDYTADVRINTNLVQLRSGVSCALSTTHCTDIEGGDTFWEATPTDHCKFSNYGVLYEGYSDKIIDTLNDHPQIVYSVIAQNTVFALTSRDKYSACGHTLTRTEHPKLIIFETTYDDAVFKRQSQISNLDIFTYMNSKFVYVEKHIRTQINQLYRNILLQQCNLEQRMLQNALAIATQSPDIFAYHLMKGPGYMALLAGEVIHIVKCVPVEVKLGQTDRCYNQLPVLRNNQTYFLTPQTHILLRQGTETNCNSLAPTMYLLGDAWYKFVPKPVDALPPTVIKPMAKPTWKYINPGSLATSGIYTPEDLEDLKDHIMFPAERPAVLNTMARGIMGRSTTLIGGSISNLLDEASMEKIAVSAWNRFWNKFLIFGNISAGLIGVYLIIRIAKLILDTLVHGYALHTVYGWSLHLVGAIWDSLTQLLLHLGARKQAQAMGHQTFAQRKGNSGASDQEHDVTEAINTYPLLPPKENAGFNLKIQE